MITITKEEHSELLISAERILIKSALNAVDRLSKGECITKVSQPLSVAYCNFIALKHYDTGRFDPAEYFNIMSPDNVSGAYSNINRHGKTT